MKISEITIENIKSFRSRTHLAFSDNLNILTGPNGGGKSNLLDILAVTINQYLFKTYEFRARGDSSHQQELRVRERFNGVEKILEKYSGLDSEPSFIKITIQLDEFDVDRINLVYDNKNVIEDKLKEFQPSAINNIDFIDVLHGIPDLKDKSFSYEINDYSISNLGVEYSEEILLFFNTYELFYQFLNQALDIIIDQPILNLTPYRVFGNINLSSDGSNLNLMNEFRSISTRTSKEQSNIFKLASDYFTLKYIHCLYSDGDADELFFSDNEVELLCNYLDTIGYKLNIDVIEKQNNHIEFRLSGSDKNILLDQLSSGEKEILHFIFAIFTYGLKGGVVIFDEPELHLHPRWQNLLLDMMFELIEKRSLQVFLVTHSPAFINYNTLENVVRIYKDSDVSNVIQCDKGILLKHSDIIKIIKTSNNEKIFFADVVVLVEGLSDRIIFEYLIEKYNTQAERIIEVLEVNGKNEFAKYQELLHSFKIKSYIIADLDYIYQLDNDEIKKLFAVDYKGIDNDVIKSPNSKDGKYMSLLLKEFVENPEECHENITNLVDLYKYIESRHLKLRDDLSEDEKSDIYRYIEANYANAIYILKKGCIEDYFDGLSKQDKIGSALRLITSGNIDQVVDDSSEEHIKEIISIVEAIIA